MMQLCKLAMLSRPRSTRAAQPGSFSSSSVAPARATDGHRDPGFPTGADERLVPATDRMAGCTRGRLGDLLVKCLPIGGHVRAVRRAMLVALGLEEVVQASPTGPGTADVASVVEGQARPDRR